MIRYVYDDKGNAVPTKPATEPYPHRGTFTSAYTIGDRVSATYDIRTAPRRSGVVWGVLFHEEVGGDSVAYKIKMDDTGQFETWASGYVTPQMMVDTSAITEADVVEAWTRIASVAKRVNVSPYHKEGASESLRVADETLVALVELIRQAEWAGGDDPCCPWCGRGMGPGKDGRSMHATDCPAARVLYPTEKP